MLDSGRSRKLTDDEAIALGVRAHAGDLTARDDLVMANVGLVCFMVGRLRLLISHDFDQAGLVGLIEAANRFDPAANPGVRFSTYACIWIKMELLNCSRKGRPVHVPHYLANKNLRELTTEHYRGTREANLRSAVLAAKSPLSLGTLSEKQRDIIDPSPSHSELTRAREEAKEEAMTALLCLSKLQRLVITRRFGLDGLPPQSAGEIAADLQYTKEGIRQIEIKALKRMRADRLRCADENVLSHVA